MKKGQSFLFFLFWITRLGAVAREKKEKDETTGRVRRQNAHLGPQA